MSLSENVEQYLDENRTQAYSLLQGLVHKTRCRYEEENQQLVREELDSLGAEIDSWYPDFEKLKEHPAYFPEELDYSGRPNLVGVIKGQGGGRSLVINAHVDVVDTGGEEKWNYGGPWSGKIEDNRLYGRGSADDLSGTALALYALRGIQAAGVELSGDVIFQSVTDEEWGGGGTLSAVLRGYTGDAALVLEPSNLEIQPVNRGGQAFRIEIEGEGIHPIHSFKGVSAIDKATKLLRALKDREKMIQLDYRKPPFDDICTFPTFAPITVGKIEGDFFPCKIPESCTFEGLLGYFGQSWEDSRREFEDFVARTAELDPWLRDHPPKVTWLGLNKEPSVTDFDHPIVRTLENSYEKVMSTSPKISAFAAGTDACFLTRYGDVPTVLFGARGFKYHSIDEYVDLDSLIDASKVVAECILNWCG